MSELAYLENQTETEFVVDNDEKAEWCLLKIKQAQEDKRKWKAQYDAMYKSVEETADSTIAKMESLLMPYFEMVPHKVAKTQESYPLPSGKLVVKKQEPSFERNDDETIKWLKANGGEGFVKVKEELDWAGLKKTVAVVGDQVANQEGEFIPGIKVVPREDIFKVEVK